MSDESVVKSVRLPRALIDRLTAQAHAEHRTVNNLITKILTESFESPTSENLPRDSKGPA